MFGQSGSVSIALASVVLDRPDLTGMYVAKDLAGGWAYQVTDHEGDTRVRGQGVCDGGLEVALRCAFLSASNRVPEYAQIRILVDSPKAHQVMVRLAVADARVVKAIAGRQVSVMTRPQERSSFHVRSAAERAAAGALQDRERAELDACTLQVNSPPVAAVSAPVEAVQTVPASREMIDANAGFGPEPVVSQGWRPRRNPGATRPTIADRPSARPAPTMAIDTAPFAIVQRMVRPLVDGARSLATAGGLGSRRPKPRNRALTDWLSEFETCVATVRADLRDVGT